MQDAQPLPEVPEINRILVATEFDRAGEDALTEARFLAGVFDAEIVLIHGVRPLAMPEFGGEADRKREVAAARERFEQIRASHPEVRFSPDPVIQIGFPAELILNAAEERNVDLIVLGGGDKTILGTVMFDPVLEKVMRTTQRPVWVVRPENPNLEVKKILCAIDPSRPTGKALAVSLFLARAFDAILELFTVVPRSSRHPTEAAEQREWLDEYLQRFSRASDREGLTIGFLARAGDPGARIVDVAEERRCEVVVMGSGGRSGLRRWLRGDTVARVARTTPCSLLTVRTVERGESGRLMRIVLPERAASPSAESS